MDHYNKTRIHIQCLSCVGSYLLRILLTQQFHLYHLQLRKIIEARIDHDINNISFDSSQEGKADYNAACASDPGAVEKKKGLILLIIITFISHCN